MPDVYDRPQCPPGCGGSYCRVDSATGGRGHESLFPARTVTELHLLRRMKIIFWEMVRMLRSGHDCFAAFTLDASWRLLRPEYGQA